MSSPWEQSLGKLLETRPAKRLGSFGLRVVHLVLSAFYGPRHEVEVNWDWIYQLGERRVRVPLHAREPVAVFRDLRREREILAGLGISLDEFTPHVVLRGTDTMRFTTSVVPRIRGRPDVLLDIDGTPPDYQKAAGSVRIGSAATVRLRRADCFDLTVAVRPGSPPDRPL
ncbi:hypothetical protein [Actinocrispum sp. NPDC049592]|uniref:hypothetical protein n=1 Tax=Actinocrispum sp. NPDC049592 TaxID=3154835 RepID=UPI003423690B